MDLSYRFMRLQKFFSVDKMEKPMEVELDMMDCGLGSETS